MNRSFYRLPLSGSFSILTHRKDTVGKRKRFVTSIGIMDSKNYKLALTLLMCVILDHPGYVCSLATLKFFFLLRYTVCSKLL